MKWKFRIWPTGSWSNSYKKSPTQTTICSFFFQSAKRNLLNCQTSSYVFFSVSVCVCICMCVLLLVFSLRPAYSWLSFLTLVRQYSSPNFWVTFCFFCRRKRDIMSPDKIEIWSIYVCYCRSIPETFKNPSTGLKLTSRRKVKRQSKNWSPHDALSCNIDWISK